MNRPRWTILLAAMAAAGCGASGSQSYRANLDPPKGPTTINLDAGGPVTNVMPTPGGLYTTVAETASRTETRVAVAETRQADIPAGEPRRSDEAVARVATTAPRSTTLPKTASPVPLEAISGLMLLASAALVRAARRGRRTT